MMIEDGRNDKSGVVSVEGKSLDTTQESSGLGNRIVVEDEDELPSRILNSSFNDTLSSTSEHMPEASRSSLPSVSMHLLKLTGIFRRRLNLSSNIGWLEIGSSAAYIY